MNRARSWPSETFIRSALAVIAGVLLAVSFPKFSLTGFAWIAPGLMLAAAMGVSGWGAFRLGYFSGLGFYLTSLHWLLYIPVSIAPIVGWLLLAGFMALYPAVWVALCWKMFPVKLPFFAGLKLRGEAEVFEEAGLSGLRAMLQAFAATTWRERLGWGLACGALWVGCEMLQGIVLTGFPWNLLGVSQAPMLPLIQIASVTGVYGVSFLVAWFSTALLCAAALLAGRREQSRAWMRELIVPAVVLAVVVGAGLSLLFSRPPLGLTLKVALVQPSIPQTTIWDSQKTAQRFGEVMQLSERAFRAEPDLLVWPESAVPSLFRWDTNVVWQGQTTYQAITGLARRHKTWMIIGADDAEPRASAPGEADYYNSSFLISPQGEVVESYRKQQLVIFGEFVPLADWLPFLRNFTQVTGDFNRGKKPVLFSIPELRVKTSVLICFEDVFPRLARAAAREQLDFLLNVTNDGWFGESAAQWQHAANALFRAVENGVPLVRAANNGLTCWVDRYGGLHDVYFLNTRDIYSAGFKVVSVPLSSGPGAGRTFYNRHGDFFGWGCAAVAAAMLVARRLVRRRGPNHPTDTSTG